VQSAIQIKDDENNFTCIQCIHISAVNINCKLTRDDTQCDCASLLTTVSKFGMHNLFSITVMV